eukprot:15963589-Heterocapsa_arctica.AAC.1
MEEHIKPGDNIPLAQDSDTSMGAQDMRTPGDDEDEQANTATIRDDGTSETASSRERSDQLGATNIDIVTAPETIYDNDNDTTDHDHNHDKDQTDADDDTSMTSTDDMDQEGGPDHTPTH